MPPRNPADRPVTEPRTELTCSNCGVTAYSQEMLNAHYRMSHRAEAAQAAAPLDEPHRDYAGRTCTSGLLHDHSEGAAPRAEGLATANSEAERLVAEADDFLRRLSHVDRDILIWIRSLLAEREAAQGAAPRQWKVKNSHGEWVEMSEGAAPRAEGLRVALERIAECDSPQCGDDHHAIARSALERRDKEGTE